jgi:hypothetical protein
MINIVNLERTQDGGVVVAHWTAEKVSGESEGKPYGFVGKTYGTKSFTPNPDSEGFVAFDDLTEETVVGWFTEEETAQIESVLDAQIAEQQAPQVISGLPW